jgi:predicted transcriptional regulator
MDDGILDPFQIKNRKRMQHVINLLSTLKEVNIESFAAKVAVNSGIDKTTVRKYLGFIKEAGLIDIRDKMIIWKGSESNHPETTLQTLRTQQQPSNPSKTGM